MPSTWLRWGTDGNGDGIADPWNAEDAITSAARYLAAAGGQTDISRAIFAYNHADWYVNEVLSISNLFGSAGSDATFQLDQMQESLSTAQQELADAGSALAAAQSVERALNRVYERRLALLSSAQPPLRPARAAAARRPRRRASRPGATAPSRRPRSRVDDARKALEQARADSQAASFSPGAGTLLGAPAYDGGWVFPVGGGPSAGVRLALPPRLSRGRHRRSRGVARLRARARRRDDVSSTTRSAEPASSTRPGTGSIWVYCHLSYRDPTVQVGAVFDAGASVGLVGHTGHATGPHLHLGLEPSTYPQDQAWFQSFAGVAFTWQDEAPAGRALTVAATTGPERPRLRGRALAARSGTGSTPIGFTLQGG